MFRPIRFLGVFRPLPQRRSPDRMLRETRKVSAFRGHGHFNRWSLLLRSQPIPLEESRWADQNCQQCQQPRKQNVPLPRDFLHNPSFCFTKPPPLPSAGNKFKPNREEKVAQQNRLILPHIPPGAVVLLPRTRNSQDRPKTAFLGSDSVCQRSIVRARL